MKKEEVVFLIGGHDLEMLEIINILNKSGIKYIDKNLSWGAKLSDYSDELSFTGVIYGVELEMDIAPPKNYIEIDHHNENSDKKSSLEQVSELLDIKLSREQELIAANDRGYIGGMKSVCATQDEIDFIRSLDRKAQGITEQDENLARKSVQNSKQSNIIFAFTPKFSSISDLVYKNFQNYIIYNNSIVLFYAYKVSDVIKFLKDKNINQSDCYYGGGEFGFVGIKENTLSKNEIRTLIKEFKR